MARAKKAPDGSAVQALVAEGFAARRLRAEGADAATINAKTIGLRLPHLAQRMLFQRTTLPFERTVIIYGPPGSSKSALLYEFYELFHANRGRYYHIDTEDKDTSLMRLALTNNDPEAGDAVTCESLSDYQVQVEAFLNWYAGFVAKKDGPKKTVPVAIGVDSLVAKMTEAAADKVRKDGGRTDKRYADEARALSDWFKVVPVGLQRLPVCLFAVNHDKPKADQVTGRVVHNAPGGAAPKYNSTYQLFAEKRARVNQRADGFEGNEIRLTMHKNALGADFQSVVVEFLWRTRAVPSRAGGTTAKLEAVWNWPKAATEQLYWLQGIESGKRAGQRGAAVNDLLALRRVSRTKYYSKPLGVPPDAPVSARRMGQLIETAAAVLEQLEPQLGIYPSFAYEPLTDYDAQVAAAAGRVDELTPLDLPEGNPLDADDGAEGPGDPTDE